MFRAFLLVSVILLAAYTGCDNNAVETPQIDEVTLNIGERGQEPRYMSGDPDEVGLPPIENVWFLHEDLHILLPLEMAMDPDFDDLYLHDGTIVLLTYPGGNNDAAGRIETTTWGQIKAHYQEG